MQATLVAPEKPRAGEETRAALLVVLVVAVALLLGWLLKMSVAGRTTTFNGLGGAVSLKYPASWVTGVADEGTPLTVYSPLSAGSFRPTFTVYARTLQKGQKLVDVATAWTMGRGAALREFHDLGSEQVTLAGQPAIRVNYAYIADPPSGSGPATLPAVVQASDTVVVQGSQYIIFSAADDANQDARAPQLDTILASIKLAGR